MSAAVGRENLLDLRERYKDRFYIGQTWMLGEAFMRILPDDNANEIPPRRITHTGQVPKQNGALPRAVDLAHAFIKYPENPIWEKWLWTSDKDSLGQRIFVGVVNGKFEIHRHLHISERWGIPAWH